MQHLRYTKREENIVENSVTFTVKDGTEYRLTYDNETGDGKQMHYLLHENGVLKLECNHHALPADLTEDEFKSSIVPLSFLNCLGRTLQDMAVKAEAEASGDEFAVELATLIRPHVTLDLAQMEYVNSIATRGHSVQLFVQLNQELEVERFTRQLSNLSTGQDDYAPANPQGKARAFVATYYPAIVFAVLVVVGVAGVLIFGA